MPLVLVICPPDFTSSAVRPVPASAMSNGFAVPFTLLGRWIALPRAPGAEGVKVTANVALLPGATVGLPGADTAKSPGFAPSWLIAPSVKSAVPGFLMVNITGAPAEPARRLPKPMFALPSTSATPAGCCTRICGVDP